MEKFENVLVEKKLVPEGTTFLWDRWYEHWPKGTVETCCGTATFPAGEQHAVVAEHRVLDGKDTYDAFIY